MDRLDDSGIASWYQSPRDVCYSDDEASAPYALDRRLSRSEPKLFISTPTQEMSGAEYTAADLAVMMLRSSISDESTGGSANNSKTYGSDMDCSDSRQTTPTASHLMSASGGGPLSGSMGNSGSSRYGSASTSAADKGASQEQSSSMGGGGGSSRAAFTFQQQPPSSSQQQNGTASGPSSPFRSGFSGLLGGGFFSRPINRSSEEMDRYIMALDR